MRDADAKVEESNMSRISMHKSAKIMQKNRIENIKNVNMQWLEINMR